jgi:hypothetical protein
VEQQLQPQLVVVELLDQVVVAELQEQIQQ